MDLKDAEALAGAIGKVVCEDCDRRADWEGVAPSRVVHACDEHLGRLLDDNYVWFVTPLRSV